MGIYDRDYYRRDGPGFLEGLTGPRSVWKTLILLNVAVFIIQIITLPRTHMALGVGWFTQLIELNADRVWHFEIWRLLTYAFAHDPDDIFHILINMLFLWMLGRDVEARNGSHEFLAFYLISAVLAGLVFILSEPNNTCLGASGAVLAVTVVATFLAPFRTILLFAVIPMPLWLMTSLYVLYDVYVFVSHQASGTAVQVHLAGAAFGFLYFKLNVRLTKLTSSLGAWQRSRSQPSLRVYREDPSEQPVSVTAPASPARADVDEQLEAKLDAVLEKVAQLGQASLTENEREILFRASEIYKRRRTGERE